MKHKCYVKRAASGNDGEDFIGQHKTQSFFFFVNRKKAQICCECEYVCEEFKMVCTFMVSYFYLILKPSELLVVYEIAQMTYNGRYERNPILSLLFQSSPVVNLPRVEGKMFLKITG